MPRGWKPGRHLWIGVSHHKGPNGATVFIKRCRLCGLEVTSQAFARAKTPWCYSQQEIDFRGPGMGAEPPEPRRPEWVQDADGTIVWLSRHVAGD